MMSPPPALSRVSLPSRSAQRVPHSRRSAPHLRAALVSSEGRFLFDPTWDSESRHCPVLERRGPWWPWIGWDPFRCGLFSPETPSKPMCTQVRSER